MGKYEELLRKYGTKKATKKAPAAIIGTPKYQELMRKYSRPQTETAPTTSSSKAPATSSSKAEEPDLVERIMRSRGTADPKGGGGTAKGTGTTRTWEPKSWESASGNHYVPGRNYTTPNLYTNAMGKSLKQGVLGLGMTPTYIGQALGLVTEDPQELAYQNRKDPLFQAYERSKREREEALNALPNNLGGKLVKNIADPILGSVPGMAADVGIMAATGNPLPVLSKVTVAKSIVNLLKSPVGVNRILRYFGDEYDNARKAGAPKPEAIANAIAYSVPAAIIEGSGGIDNIVNDIMANKQKTLLGKFLAWGKESHAEGLEESAQTILQHLTSKLTYDPNATLAPSEVAQSYGLGLAGGAIMGGALHAGAAATNKVTNQIRSQKQADLITHLTNDLMKEQAEENEVNNLTRQVYEGKSALTEATKDKTPEGIARKEGIEQQIKAAEEQLEMKRQTAIENTKRQTTVTEQQVDSFDQAHKATLKQKGIEFGDAKVVKLAEAPLTKKAQKTREHVETISKFLGVKTAFVDVMHADADTFHGSLHEGVLYINSSVSNPELVTLLHETVHQMKQTTPEIYTRLVKAVAKGAKGKYGEDIESLVDNQVLEEMLANAVGKAGMNEDFWTAVRGADRNAYKKFLDVMDTIINSISKRFGKSTESSKLKAGVKKLTRDPRFADFEFDEKYQEFEELIGSMRKFSETASSALREFSQSKNEIAQTYPDAWAKLPADSEYKKGVEYSLKRVSSNIAVRRGAGDEIVKDNRVFMVSILDPESSFFKDKPAKDGVITIEQAEKYSTSPERVKDWQEIYSNAVIMDKFGDVKKENKDGKLAGISVISLTKGCQRTVTTIERVSNGILPAETIVEACYGGDCWVNKQFNSKFSAFENMEIRDLKLANSKLFDKWLANTKNKEFLTNTLFIRHGQQGDDSHLFATGIAREWLKALKKVDILTTNVFITAGYAPVTQEQYAELLPYKDQFVIHFSNSGWFHKNEITLRFNEYLKARETGLNAVIRLVTNKDKISGLEVANQEFLEELLKKYNVPQEDILETPFHDDELKKKKGAQDRSKPTGDFKNVCCETGKCKTCMFSCMSKRDYRAKGINTVQDRLNNTVNYSEKLDYQKLTNPFYSHLEKVINSKMQLMSTPEQVMGLVRNNNVKQDEIKWSGIEQWLTEKKGKITKQEVLDFIKENEIEIKEVIKDQTKVDIFNKLKDETNGSYSVLTEAALKSGMPSVDAYNLPQKLVDGRVWAYDLPKALLEPALNYIDTFNQYLEAKGEQLSPTKYADYQLPGGENYRELLLTIPPDNEYKKHEQKLIKKYGEEHYLSLASKEELAERGSLFSKPPKMNFHSQHFEERNIVAHVRFNTRTGAKGEKILFLEEVQSDWHEQGRKKGYKTLSDKEYEQIRDNARAAIKRNDYLGFDTMVGALQAVREAPDFAVRWEIDTQQDIDALTEYRENVETGRVPEAPWKKTWHELALKRMIRYAAENGYDRIAWTTGEQQANRYNLADVVSSLKYRNNGDGTYGIYVFGNATPYLLNEDRMPIEKVTDYVGKDVAEKIAAGEGAESGPFKVLWPKDLKVGGSGMKGFYDKIIPDYLNKYAKKWGARVEETVVNPERLQKVDAKVLKKAYESAHEAGDTEAETFLRQQYTKIQRGEEPSFAIYNSNESASKYVNEARTEPELKQPSLPITPAMKQSVLYEGQPKYSDKLISPQEYASFIEKFGAIQKGENLYREESVPSQTTSNNRVRQFARTAMEAEATPNAMVEPIKQGIVEGALSYKPLPDKKAKHYATKYIELHGYEKAVEKWKDVVNGDEPLTKENIVLGEMLYKEAAQAGNVELAMKLLAEVAAEATRAGQVVQALRLLKKMTPEGQLYYMQRTVNSINRELLKRFQKDAQLYEVSIDKNLAKAFLNAKTQEETNALTEMIYQNIADQIPANWVDKWNSWRYFAMLGNIRTHIRNLIGNGIFVPVRSLKNAIGTGLEYGLPEGEKTKAILTSADKDLVEFAREDYATVKDSISHNGKYNPSDAIRDRMTIFDTAILEKLRKFNMNMLDKEDAFFLKLTYANSLAQWMKANDKTKQTITNAELETARNYAVSEALKATYRDASKVANMLNRLSKSSTGLGLVIGGVMPFTKTPINILKRGIEYSPAGLINGVYNLAKYGRSAESLDKIAAGLSGTMIMALGAWLGSLGLITGGADDEKREQNFDELQGIQNYALNIGGYSYTIDWTSPIALPLFVGVELYNVGLTDIFDSLTKISEPMFNLSMLQGINSTIKSAANGEGFPLTSVILNSLTNYVGQANPTILGQLARTVDDTRRDAYYKDKTSAIPESIQGVLNRNAAKLPGVSKRLPAYVDEWGRTNDKNLLMRGFENLLSPGYLKQENVTALDKVLRELYNRTGESSVLPTSPEKYITVGGKHVNLPTKRVDLTPKQYERYSILKGQTSFDYAEQVVNDLRFNRLDDEEKVKIIQDAYELANASAKMQITSYVPTNTTKNILKSGKINNYLFSRRTYTK